MLAANPTLPAIVTTHDGLGIASDAVTAVEGEFAKRMWDKLIKDSDQIFLTINGHNHGAAHLRKTKRPVTASTRSSGTTRWPTRAATATWA